MDHYRSQFLISVKFDGMVVPRERNFGCRCSPSYEKDISIRKIFEEIAYDSIFDIS